VLRIQQTGLIDNESWTWGDLPESSPGSNIHQQAFQMPAFQRGKREYKKQSSILHGRPCTPFPMRKGHNKSRRPILRTNNMVGISELKTPTNNPVSSIVTFQYVGCHAWKNRDILRSLMSVSVSCTFHVPSGLWPELTAFPLLSGSMFFLVSVF
jgi:hypothetical protein